MGCNYYLVSKPCITCGSVSERKHIGKSSAGWQFHFRGYPPEIVSFSDWVSEFGNLNKEIIDEHHRRISPQDFIDIVYCKKEGMSFCNIISNIPMNAKEREYLEHNKIDYEYQVLGSWKDNEGFSFTGREFS